MDKNPYKAPQAELLPSQELTRSNDIRRRIVRKLSNARALFWTIATLISWGIWAVLAKEIGDALSPSQSQVLSTIGLLPLLAALALIKQPPVAANRRRGIALAFASGVVSCIGNIPYYAALGGGNAATIVPLAALYPLVTVLLAVVLLKERLNRIQVCGVLLSLAAIYLFNLPGEQGAFSPWELLALVSLTLWGVTGLLQKMATNEISGSSSSMWFLIAFVVVAGCMLVYEPMPSDVSLRTWLLVTALGFALALGNCTILLAFAAGGKASIIMPLTGLYPLVSIPIAILRYGETMDWRGLLGAILALAGVVTLSYDSRPAAATDSDHPTSSS
jgi:drug/metabolite transporter (DMT)-like permease